MSQSFNTTFAVNKTPQQIVDAIARPEIWWNELIEGSAAATGDEFGFHMPGVHTTKIRVTESTPGKRVVWHVLDNHFSFVDDQDEWLGTDVVFDIEPGAGEETTVRVTHVGLVPEFECYEVCSGAWTHHLNAGLRALLTTGHPAPTTAEKAAEVAAEFAAKAPAASK
ncbi:SRPBCC family protein [Streptomyces qinglanensis]|uniref:SRPBCC family protein n=1 Tax=Streptomyces qinglanensis TaxID=943816 RepID=UPI003D7421B1